MSLVDSIKSKLSNLTTLEIVTAVGPPTRDENGRLTVDLKTNSAVMFTQIRLLEGDVTTSVDPSFVSGENQPLRAFHQTRVTEGMQAVKDNISALKQLYQLMTAIERDTAED
ncbi:MAG: hypothetical protein ACI9U2_001723 [Bradymonadia bacterium]|jgi:hypothetical protein